MHDATRERSYFRPDIQGLRAFAVLAVVGFHARVPLFSGGFVGVDIFFVISGFLITGLLVRELDTRGRIDFPAFYARRIRRLLPAAMVVLVATAAAAWILLSPLEQRELVPSLLTSALYVSNLWFAWQATDYLGGDLHVNPLLHTWSLSVEEQFYLAWPLLVALGTALGGRSRARRGLWLVMLLVCGGSLGASLWGTHASQPWAFFGSPMRAWEFAAGGLVYMGMTRLPRLSGWAVDCITAGGFVVMLAAVVGFDSRTLFPGFAALVPVLGAMAVVMAGGSGEGRIGRWLSAPVVQLVGNLSYSWYLWHWPALTIPESLIGPLGAAARVACVLGSLALASVTYAVIENPARLSRALARTPRRSIAFGLCLTVISVTGAMSLRASSRAALSTGEQAEYFAVRRDLPPIYRDECHVPLFGTTFGPCVFGDPVGPRTMALFGDSHAAQWFPALERIAREEGWRLLSFTKSACPSATVRRNLAALGRDYHECTRWREMALERIAAERAGLVVVANADGYVTKEPGGVSANDWREGARNTLLVLRRAGAAVAILHDTPKPGFDVPTCLSRASWRHEKRESVCSFEKARSSSSTIFDLDQSAARGIDRVGFVDLSDVLCPERRCPVILLGHVAYRDDHHLTASVTAQLAPLLKDRLQSLLPR